MARGLAHRVLALALRLFSKESRSVCARLAPHRFGRAAAGGVAGQRRAGARHARRLGALAPARVPRRNGLAAMSALRVVHLNSMLKGGGTDDQCVKLAHGLLRTGLDVRVAGPDGREFSRVVRELGVPFHATPPEGPLKLRFM